MEHLSAVGILYVKHIVTIDWDDIVYVCMYKHMYTGICITICI